MERKEISGMTPADDDCAAAVQDEEGHIYIVNITAGTVTGAFDFSGKGNCEEVAPVEDAGSFLVQARLVDIRQ